MEAKTNNRDYVVYASLLGAFLVLLICMWALFGDHGAGHDPRPVYRARLTELVSAVRIYYMDYGELLSPAEFRSKLLECHIVEDEQIFYWGRSGVAIRYFTSGDRFVLVMPGPNGRYDTPEGYENLRNTKEAGDDILRFSFVYSGKENGERPKM